MSEAKHSPAPWRSTRTESIEKGAVAFVLEDANGRYLCYLSEGSDKPDLRYRGWVPLAEAEANARLIAASPKLLAAVVAIFTPECWAMYEGEELADQLEMEVRLTKEELFALRDAIREATGEIV